MYSYALLSKKEKKISDCCAFLGIAEKLIKTFAEKTKNNKFLHVSAQVYLFISSLLISDEEFYTAQLYQKKIFVICFRLISYLNPNNDYLNVNKLKKSNRNYVEKAVLCISIAFYHRGICEETIGNLMKSTESYSQAKWFSEKFLIESFPQLVNFFHDVHKRVERDAKLFEKNKGVIKINSAFQNILKISKTKLKKFNEMDFLKLEYKDTIKKIELLKFPHFDEDRKKDHNVQEILYTLRMTNFLMSDEFKNIVSNLEKVNVHKMDKDTKDIINKKLIELRSRESYEKFCNFINYNEKNEQIANSKYKI